MKSSILRLFPSFYLLPIALLCPVLCAASAIKLSATDTGMINSYNQRGTTFLNSNPDSTVILGKLAEALSLKIGWDQGRAVSLTTIGRGLYALGKLEEAIAFYNLANEISVSLADHLSISKCQNNLGIVFLEKGEHARALEHFFSALGGYEK